MNNMEQDKPRYRILYAKGTRPKSFKDKDVRCTLRKTNIKGYSGSVYGYHLSYREKTAKWWQSFLCWKIYDTDSNEYKEYVREVIQKLVDKLNTAPI